MFDNQLGVSQTGEVLEQGVEATAAVLDLRDRLVSLVQELDVGMVDVQAAPDLWDAFDQVEKLGAAGKLLVGQRVDESGVAKARGFKNTAEYLARRSGCPQRAAGRQLQASEKLARLPATAAALRGGELSADQAAAIADAAAADPQAERSLLLMAGRVSLRELQDACLRVKAKADPDPEKTRRRQQKERFLRHGRRPDGTFSLYGQGPPEDEGLLQAALRHGIEDRFRAKAGTNGDDGEIDGYDQRAYDALFDILRTHIAEGPFADLPDDDSHRTQPADRSDRDGRRTGTSSGGDRLAEGGSEAGGRARSHRDGHRPRHRGGGGAEGSDPQTGNPPDSGLAGLPPSGGQLPLAGVAQPERDSVRAGPGSAPGQGCERCGCTRPDAHGSSSQRRRRRRRRANPTYTTLVRVDLEALNRGWQEGDEVCDMPGLGPISVPAARVLLPESIVRLIITRGQEVASVVHAGRGPNTAQKMALYWLQPTCTVEGCNSQIVQADHRIDWAATHHTTLAELDHLCPHHHDLKTHKSWALVPGDGKRAFVPPADPRHPNQQLHGRTGDRAGELEGQHPRWSAAA